MLQNECEKGVRTKARQHTEVKMMSKFELPMITPPPGAVISTARDGQKNS